ncbi:MAG: aminotransferase class III-fold pyridoxal phosphate-dependent enzyme [Deltaproteobacteria bacterium]|nr:aminotransferase class III-fold pyridoxal phosphate-dependent enzyme [Deltaproteobacteria bacterium]
METALNPTLRRLLTLCRLDHTWVRGEGVWLTDTHGRRFLDCYAQYGAVGLGHNAPCVTAAVRAALDNAEPAMVQPYRAPHAEALATTLTRLAPGDLTHCVFTTSGAEAVEAAIKLVRARTGRPLILSAQGSFHGKTLGALALTGQSHHADGFGPPLPGFAHIPFGDTEALAARLGAEAAHIAAVFLEPIQGERGVYLPPPGYLSRVRELCHQYDVALVLDEIQTGLGRTGKLFACEHDQVAPDVLLLAKTLGGGVFPLGACLTTDAWWDEHFALRHSSTFANNNIACRVGLAVLETLTQGGVCHDVARKGDHLHTRLAQLVRRYPHVLAASRGRGLLGALELQSAATETSAFLSFIAHHGLYAYAVAATVAEEASVLVLPTLGDASVLRLAPPLTITDVELDLALDGIEAVCARLATNPADTIARALGAFADAPAPATRHRTRPHVTSTAVSLPASYWQPDGPLDYAFLVHYTSLDDVVATDPGLASRGGEELRRFCSYTAQFPPGVILHAPTLRSATGATAQGVIIALPMLPDDMARHGQRRVNEDIRQAVALATRLGARIVGLGGYTTPYSRRGLSVINRGPAITTGNALTAGVAFATTQRLAYRQGLSFADANVAVIGARGSVGMLMARLCARQRPRHLLLVGNPQTGVTHLQRLRDELSWGDGTITVTTDLGALVHSQIIITATGAGRPVLDEVPLTVGTLICDVARPYDTSLRLRSRSDLTVIDGGLVSLPDPTTCFGPGNLQGLPDGIQLACLAETMLLALEGDTRNHGIGDAVPLTEVDEMMALAQRHGFGLAPLPGDGIAMTCQESAIPSSCWEKARVRRIT